MSYTCTGCNRNAAHCSCKRDKQVEATRRRLSMSRKYKDAKGYEVLWAIAQGAEPRMMAMFRSSNHRRGVTMSDLTWQKLP